MHTTSQSLLQRVKQTGQTDAWNRLVHLYTPLLWHWTKCEGVSPQDQADLVQEVFVVLLRKLPNFTYDPERTFRGWLRTLLRNTWRNQLQRRLRWPQELDAARFPVAADDADGLAETEYRTLVVGRALELLRTDFQPTTWQAFWEYQVRGRRAAEVSAELGISVGAIYTARVRVLNRLRQELAGLLD